MHEFLENHVRAFYRLLNHGDEYTDCRCIDVNRPGSPPLSREVLKGEDQFASWCLRHNGKANCYAGRNPRNADGTVSRLTTYSHDIDPVHPAGTSVSREALEAALLEGRRVLQAWPGGYLAESGNGAMVLYRLAVAHTGDFAPFERWLAGRQNEIRKALADGEVRCDSVHDSARIVKVPGTMSVKGDSQNWRVARFVDLPSLPYRTAQWSAPHPTTSTYDTPTKTASGYTASSRLLQLGGELEKARECLSRLSAARCSDYDSWLRVGLALHSLGDAGLPLWEEWSRKSPKHADGVCVSKWATFKGDPKITVGSLLFWANEDDPTGRYLPGFQGNRGPGEIGAQSFDDFAKDSPPLEWIAPPVIAKKSITFFAGLPETMKTWMAMDLAIECARPDVAPIHQCPHDQTCGICESGQTIDRKWLGLFEVKQQRVMYVEQERTKGETLRRLKAVARAKGLSDADLKDRLFVECGTTIRVNLEHSYQALRSELSKIRPDLLIVDTFGTFHTCDEKHDADMQALMERVKALRNEFGCAFVFVDHEVKSAFSDEDLKIEPTYLRMKGAVAKSAAADSVLTVRRFDNHSSKVYHTKNNLDERVPSFMVRALNSPDKDHIVVAGES